MSGVSFPEEMTIPESEKLIGEGVFSDFETFDDLEVAKTFMEAFKRGLSEREVEVYTQVDSDSGDRVYVRGIHFVNRTGVYLVAWR